jgi:hypothetical protein
VDLVPNVVLVCADQADAEGNLYTGPNTEDTPVIVEAAAFHDGIVIVQVNQIGTPGYLFYRTGWQPAFKPGAVSACRTVCGRWIYWFDTADGRRC